MVTHFNYFFLVFLFFLDISNLHRLIHIHYYLNLIRIDLSLIFVVVVCSKEKTNLLCNLKNSELCHLK